MSKDELHNDFREAFLYVNNLGWKISSMRYKSEEKCMSPLMAMYCYYDKITNIDKIGRTLFDKDLTRMFYIDITSIMHLFLVIKATMLGRMFEADIFRVFWTELGVRMGKDPLIAKCIYTKDNQCTFM